MVLVKTTPIFNLDKEIKQKDKNSMHKEYNFFGWSTARPSCPVATAKLRFFDYHNHIHKINWYQITGHINI